MDDNIGFAVDAAFRDLYDEAPDEPNLYSVRVILTNDRTHEIRACIIPWATYLPEQAEMACLSLYTDPRAIASFGSWYTRKHINDSEPGIWLPTAAKVVNLAPIPF